MEESTFFKKVWRLNALIILVAGILAILLLLIGGYHTARNIFGSHQATSIVNVAEDAHIDEDWTFGYMESLEGTDFTIVALESDQSYSQSYYSKSSASYRNFLFINSSTNKQNWLFPNNKWLITHKTLLSENTSCDSTHEVSGLLYIIVKKDTDGDKRLTNKDKVTVILSSPSGDSYTEILPSIDRMIGHNVVSSDAFLILYKKDGVAYSAKYSLHDFSLINESDVPLLND